MNKVRITKEAFDKMNKYARLVSEITGGDIECGGKLLNYYYEEDDITRDVHLAEWQEVTSAEGFLNSGQNLEDMLNDDKKICGMWHSHGRMHAFHSRDDDMHSELLYRTNFMGNKVTIGKKEYKPKIKKEKGIMHIRLGKDSIKYCNGMLTIKGQEGKTVRIKLKGKIKEVTGEQREEIGFINSIVINRDSYLYGIQEQGRSYYAECLAEKTGKIFERAKNLELELIDENNGIVKDERSLVREVGESVSYNGRKLKEYPNYEEVLRKYENKGKVGYKQKLRKFYGGYTIEDETDKAIVNIAKILAGDFKVNGKKMRRWDEKTREAWKQYRLIRKISKEKTEGLQDIYDSLKNDSYLKRKHPEKIKELRKICKGRTAYMIGNGCIYACMGILAVSMVALKGIEDVSLHHLNKTRPDVVEMIKKGAKFSEVAKQYYKQDGK